LYLGTISNMFVVKASVVGFTMGFTGIRAHAMESQV
jgi:hypothetical protein